MGGSTERLDSRIVVNMRTELDSKMQNIHACNTFIRYPSQSQVNQKESIKNQNPGKIEYDSKAISAHRK